MKLDKLVLQGKINECCLKLVEVLGDFIIDVPDVSVGKFDIVLKFKRRQEEKGVSEGV